MLPARYRYGLFAGGTALGIAAFFLLGSLGVNVSLQFAVLALLSAVIPSAILGHLNDDESGESTDS